MPARKNKKTTKPRRARKPAGRRRGVASKSKTNVADFAGLSCTRTLAQPIVGNQMYKYNTFCLRDFPRAVQVAKAYQHYRISGIKLTFKPAFDTYSSALGAGQKPNLYYMIDKADSIPTTATLESLKQMGARPKNFDEKPIHITWTPSVLTADQDITIAAAVSSQYKVGPWLSTSNLPGGAGVWSPSVIAHKGLTWYMEQPGAVSNIYVEVEVQFQFKKPLFDMVPSPTPAKSLDYAVIDGSPDGVVGGTDGI